MSDKTEINLNRSHRNIFSNIYQIYDYDISNTIQQTELSLSYLSTCSRFGHFVFRNISHWD